MAAAMDFIREYAFLLIIMAFFFGGWIGFFAAALCSVARSADAHLSYPAAGVCRIGQGAPPDADSQADQDAYYNSKSKRDSQRIAAFCLIACVALAAVYGLYRLLAPVYAGGVF